MTTSCDDVRSVAAEVALGLVTGPERGEVLAHLDPCPSCRRDVDALAAASDRILLLAAEAEPPAGFETSVLRRIAAQASPVAGRPPLRRQRAGWILGVAAAVVLVAVAAGIAVGRSEDRPQVPAIASAPMLTPDGQLAGEVYLREGDPSWVFLTAPSWSHWEDEVYVLEAVLTDGQVVELGTPALDEGSGAWGTATTIDVDHIREIKLVGEDGHVWCSATLA